MAKKKTRLGKRHIYIPDMQILPGRTLAHCDWIGRFLADRQPDVIVNAGDFADMPSLSSYDRGKKAAEGTRYQKDIESVWAGMERLVTPIEKVAGYKPQMVLTYGNHEERILRHVENHPYLEGYLSMESLAYSEYGWDCYDFLEPAVVDGIAYSHFFANPMNGKPMGGAASNVLKNVGMSCIQGHKQTLDVATRTCPITGKQSWCIIAGAAYPYNFAYKGPTGNRHWRGVVELNEVNDGDFDPMFVSLDYLRRTYGD